MPREFISTRAYNALSQQHGTINAAYRKMYGRQVRDARQISSTVIEIIFEIIIIVEDPLDHKKIWEAINDLNERLSALEGKVESLDDRLTAVETGASRATRMVVTLGDQPQKEKT